jgi:hypothetical protein
MFTRPATMLSAAAIVIGAASATITPSRAADLSANGDRGYQYSERERSVDREVHWRNHREYSSRSADRYAGPMVVHRRTIVEQPTIIEHRTIVERPIIERHVVIEEPAPPLVVVDPVLRPIVAPPPPFVGYVADDDD